MAHQANHTPFNGRGGDRQLGSPSEMSDRGSTVPRSMNSTMMSPFGGYSDSNDTSLVFSPPESFKPTRGNFSTAERVAGLSDPFTTSQPSQTRPSASLNAAASSFQPSMFDRRDTKSAAADTFGVKYLANVIANNEQPAANQFSRSGMFTRDMSQSRVLKVTCRTEGSAVASVQNYVQLMNRRMHGSQTFDLISDRVVYIRHTHITDAIAVHDVLASAPELGQASYYAPKMLGDLFPQYTGRVTDYEGQMSVTINYPQGARTGISKHVFESKIRETVEMQGTLHAYESHSTPNNDEMRMIIEFDNIERVPRAVQRLNGIRVDGSVLNVKAHHPDVSRDPYAYLTLPSTMGLAEAMGNMSITPEPPFLNDVTVATYSPQNPVMYGGHAMAMYNPQPMLPGQSTIVPYGQQLFVVTPMPAYGMQPYNGGFQPGSGDYHHGGGYNGRSRGWNHRPGRMARRHPNHDREENSFKKSENMVKVERIHAGLDVRTTVMLRNIPNKMTQPELKKILDDICYGKYDFLYLRIDFSNNCNVGYAFINFLDPLDIIPFLRARANRRWDFYRSDKVAEVSYATIQGRDCLIQKFRNSSVMLEGEECRPKLFYTEGHPMVGQEEPFPCADNQSKLKRSCENAEHVGLFAPAVGQHFRHEQRYRNSQFDRGTSMAIRERDFDDSFRGGYIDFGNGYGGNNDCSGRGGFGEREGSNDSFEIVRGRGRFGGHRGDYRGNSGYDSFEESNGGPPFGY